MGRGCAGCRWEVGGRGIGRGHAECGGPLRGQGEAWQGAVERVDGKERLHALGNRA